MEILISCTGSTGIGSRSLQQKHGMLLRMGKQSYKANRRDLPERFLGNARPTMCTKGPGQGKYYQKREKELLLNAEVSS